MRPRARAVLWPVAALALVLAGCASIPSSGPVVAGRPVDGGSGHNVIKIFPVLPSPEMTPRELVLQFLRAAPAFEGDHEGSRSFLLAGRRTAWRPDSPVTIYSCEDSLTVTVTRGTVSSTGPLLPPAVTASPSHAGPVTSSPSTSPSRSGSASSPSRTGPATPTPTPTPVESVLDARPAVGESAAVVVRGPVQAHIDADGQYLPADAGATEQREFRLVGTADGWRISSLADGIMITRYDFGNIYRDLPVYFADPTGSYLVPDVRWFPVSGSSTASSLVSTLLAGPADWLRTAVVTGAPPGTQPTVNAVKVVDGVATVDLSAPARTADARQRTILKAQLEATLGGLASLGTTVNSVAVTVEQQRFELQPAAVVASPPVARDETTTSRQLGQPPQVDARPVVVDARGAIARLVGRSAVPVTGLGALALAGAWAPAVDASGQAFAVLVANRSRLLYAVPGGPATLLMTDRDLVPPSFDPFGWVWSGPQAARGELLAARPDVAAVHVSASWLGDRRLVSTRLSREGARAVLVTESGGRRQVFLAGVRRDASGRPLALADGVELLPDAQDVVAASWVDATHVAVLARRPGSAAQPWIVQLGGEARGTLPASGVWLTAGNSESDLYVQTATGTVRSRVGSSWSDVPGVKWPSMPG